MAAPKCKKECIYVCVVSYIFVKLVSTLCGLFAQRRKPWKLLKFLVLFAFVFHSCVLFPCYSSVSTCALRQCDVTRRGRDGGLATVTWSVGMAVPKCKKEA